MAFIGIIKVKLKTKSGRVIKWASLSIRVLCTAAGTSGFSHFVCVLWRLGARCTYCIGLCTYWSVLGRGTNVTNVRADQRGRGE